jgi:outer membrane lipoprotein SlyB
LSLVSRLSILGLPALVLAALAGCTPDFSPNTYSTTAVQQANKVERAVVIGFRQVEIKSNGTVGAVSGGAAGGILGAQAGDTNVTTALGTVGGTLVGGIVGTFIERVAGDTTGWEYIVRKPDNELLSVTQREPQPLPIGQKVLVITGNQARVIADYSASADPPSGAPQSTDKPTVKTPPEGAAAATPQPVPASGPAAPIAPPPSPPTPSAAAAEPPAPATASDPPTASPAPTLPAAASGGAEEPAKEPLAQ